MEQLTIEAGAKYLLSKDNFLILTHRRPDGDTAGCGALLCRALRAVGKTAAILENPQLTDRYAAYHQGLTVKEVPDGATIVTVDVAGREMLPMGAENLEVDFLVDHHGSNKGFAPQGIIVPEAAACGEIVYDLMKAMGIKLDKSMAEALYVAVSTDTGCFRFGNTRAKTLRTAADCLELGIDAYAMNKKLFETVRLNRLKLDAYMAENLVLLEGGQVALNLIPLEVEQELGITENDMENVANFARNIEGVGLAVTFRTLSDGKTKLSMRASPDYDVSKAATALGGGGHKAAAAATLPCDQSEAMLKVLEILRKQNILS